MTTLIKLGFHKFNCLRIFLLAFFLANFAVLSAQVRVPIYSLSSGGGATGTVHPSTNVPTYFGSIGQAMVYQRNVATDNGAGVLNAANLMFSSSVTPATLPSTVPTALQFTNVTSTSFTVSFTDTSTPAGYLVLRKAASAVRATPTVGISYTLSNTLDDATIAYVGALRTFNESGLAPNTNYHYVVFPFNGTGPTSNYLVTAPLTGIRSTLDIEPTGSPTFLSFTQVATTSMTVSFTDASPVPSGYITIRKTGSAPTSTPVDGINYVLGGALGDGIVTALGNANSFQEIGLTPFTTYFYVVYSFNGTIGTYNYLTTGPGTNFQKTLSADNTPPEVTSTTATSIPPASTLTIRATVKEGVTSNVDAVTIEYRSVSAAKGAPYTSVLITAPTTGDRQDGVWQINVPAAEIGELGVEYKIIAINSTALTTTAVGNTNISFETVQDFTFNSFGSEQANYRIISVPLLLQNKTVNEVFSDDLNSDDGIYDNTKFRMYRYEAGSTTELKGSSNIDIGKGYWLIVKDNTPIDIGAGSTPSVSTDKPFTIDLVQGWNQIGNPYLFNVLWSDVLVASGGATLTLKTWLNDWVPSSTKLNKFEGGFVQTGTPVKLTFPVARNSSAGRSSEVKETKNVNALDSDNWEVRFQINNGNRKNEFGGVGMNPMAKDGYDGFDDFTLPRFQDYLELNHHKKVFGMTYTKDIVPTTENFEWEFTVESNLEGETSMTWDNSYFGENDNHLSLWDSEEQLSINMRAANQYSFQTIKPRSFRIFFGNEEYVKEQTTVDKLVIHSISPNPTDSETKISFSLAGTEDSFATVRVLNLLGQPVSTVHNGTLTSGFNEVVWSGKDYQGIKPAQGVYIVEIMQGIERGLKRLIVK